MGSVVKSIGRVFKKAGKALKKIAPVLLVAAAAYVGYGFATGFSGGGWPKITGWGKSLMRGIRGGSTLSQAASQASQGITGEVATSAVTPAVSGITDAFDPSMGPGGASEFASTQGLLSGTPTISPSGDYMAMGPFSGLVGGTPDATSVPATSGLTARDIRGRPPSLYEALFNPAEEQLVQAQVANPSAYVDVGIGSDIPQATADPVVVTATRGGAGAQALSPDVASQSATGAATVMPARTFDMSTLTSSGPGLASLGSGASNAGNVDLNNPQTWIAALGAKAGRAWEFYKELWKNDPMIALYGTNKVIQMVAAMLAEDEKDKKYEFGGFPDNVSYADMAKNLRSKGLPMPKAKPGTVFGPGRGLLSPQGANV